MSNLRALSRPVSPDVDAGLVPLERSVGYHVRTARRDVAGRDGPACGGARRHHQPVALSARAMGRRRAFDRRADATRRPSGPDHGGRGSAAGEGGARNGRQIGRRPPQEFHPSDAARATAGGSHVAAHPRRQRSGHGRSVRERNPHLQAAHRPHPANARCRKRATATTGRSGARSDWPRRSGCRD